MLLLLGQLAQPLGDRERLGALAELHERLDEVGGDREGAGLVDALALPCAPRPARRCSAARAGSCASSAAVPSARRASRPCQP